MPALVLDASVTISVLFEEDRSDEAHIIFRTVVSDGAIVPAFWPMEVAHILLLAARRRLLDATACL